MFSLLFLICNETMCMSASPSHIFRTKEQCEDAGYTLLEEGQKDIDSGEVPAHKAMFVCHSWGAPV